LTLFDDYLDACEELADFCVDNEADILLGFGITAVVGAVVLTGIATTKFIRETDEVKAEIEEHNDEVETAIEAGEADEDDLIEGKEEFEMTLKAYFKAARWYVIPAVALGLGLAAIGKSHAELKDDISGWAAAYVGLDTVFRKYRERVVEEEGKEKDAYYRFGGKKVEVEEEYEDAKGKKKTRTVEELVLDGEEFGEFTKFFDESCEGKYREDPEYNWAFLHQMERNVNNILLGRYKGKKPARLYLNEVYDLLGFERTVNGQLYGWEYDPKTPGHDSLYPVSFGIVKHKRPNRRFLNGLEPVVLMDFNCYRLIGKRANVPA